MKNFTQKFIGILALVFTMSFTVNAQVTVDYSYTGSVQEWIVPCGVTEIEVDAYGASGTTGFGGGNNNLGKGGQVEGTIAVTPGQILKIYVGGSSHYPSVVAGWNGGGGSNGGDAGGGATDIRIGGDELTDRILVAGGAGGRPATGRCGAHGGGLIASNGCTGNYEGNDGAGKGGSQSSGGEGAKFWGAWSYQYTSPGGFGYGSSGSSQTSQYGEGGGGGGGWYGGSGGGSGGGGGGSSYTHPDLVSNVIHTKGVQTGAGKIFISYNVGDVGSCYVDECGVINGDNSSCSDECGVPNGDNSSCADECGVPNGDNSSCSDECGVPNGDNSSCADECGVPNGDNTTCMDECDIPNGDNSSCADECGVPNGDNISCTDECGVINGDNSSCSDECGVPNGPGYYYAYIDTDGDGLGEGEIIESCSNNVLENNYVSTGGDIEITGCTNSEADNYLSSANTDDGTCIITGCMDSNYAEYNENANTDDGSCSCPVSVDLNVSDASCDLADGSASIYGLDCNYNSEGPWVEYCLMGDGDACLNSMSSQIELYDYPWQFDACFNNHDEYMCGQAANMYPELMEQLLSENNSEGPWVEYCLMGDGDACLNTMSSQIELYDYPWQFDACFNNHDEYMCGQAANMYPELMEQLLTTSCYSWADSEGSLLSDQESVSDLSAGTYTFAYSNGECSYSQIFDVGLSCSGCTDASAFNYNENANLDDSSCIAVVTGCMDSTPNLMSNYNPEANTEDVSCVSWEELANNLQSELDNVVPEDGVSQEDVDAAYAAGAASVEAPECEEVATQNMPLDLPQGWSMFGYTCMESLNAVYAFSEISDKIEIVKDEWGLSYLPAWGFSAFDNLEYGKGYQVKMNEEVTDFQFCEAIVPEDGVSQYDVDSVQALLDATISETLYFDAAYEDLESQLETAMSNQEDGVSQADVDAAVAEAVAEALAEVDANYAGWCESDLDNDGICDIDEVWGCMDASSCNYLSTAEFDNGSCDYVSCLDECGVINGDNSSCLDCAGVVNGTSEDLGCGCGNPAAQEGYDCDGNVLPQIGDQYAGGIVFQINEDGTGLVADLQDLENAGWHDAMDAAASSTSQGYDDWFLPSIEELMLMYITIGNGGAEGNIGGFTSNGFTESEYWSSSEAAYYLGQEGGENLVWNVRFDNGNVSTSSKAPYATLSARAIRAF